MYSWIKALSFGIVMAGLASCGKVTIQNGPDSSSNPNKNFNPNNPVEVPTVLSDAPQPQLDIFMTNQNVALNLQTSQLLSNDTHPDGDALSITKVESPVSGTVVLNGSIITFTPTSGFNGTGSFKYTVSNGKEESVMKVIVNVVPTSAVSVASRTASRSSIALYATVQTDPARIVIRWPNVSGVTRNSVLVRKKIKGAPTWGASQSATASSNFYIDNSVTAGVEYEYKVEMNTSGGQPSTIYGYLSTGIGVPAAEEEGIVIVVADSSLFNASSSQILNLEETLSLDGWQPKTIFVSRTATAPTVKTAIKNVYDDDPTRVKAVLLLGHIPVPYSGTSIGPDGHNPEHVGAWPADGYYGDMDYTWTEGGGAASAMNMGTGPEINEYPHADSKFDHNFFPSEIELQVGRIDMYNLPAFGQTETQLINTYLTKSANFKKGTVTVQKRGLIVDQLGGAGYLLAISAQSNMSGAVGPSSITYVEDINSGVDAGTQPFWQRVNNQTYLFGYGTGYGSNSSSQTVATTADIASSNMSSVFNFIFGSWFGDINSKNNLMRSFTAKGLGLNTLYSGDLLVYTQQMAMGNTIGYSVRENMNNTSSKYVPIHGSCCGGSSHNVYSVLVGDPTHKISYPRSASDLTVNDNQGSYTLSWTAPSAPVDGYNIYAVENGRIAKINQSLITETTSPSLQGNPSGKQFMVRSVRYEVTPAGIYENLSLGVMSN